MQSNGRSRRKAPSRRALLNAMGASVVAMAIIGRPANAALTLGFTLMSGIYRVKVQPIPASLSVERLVQELTMTDWDPVPGARVEIRRDWDDDEVHKETSDHEGRTLHRKFDYYPGDTIYVTVQDYIPSGRGTL